ncbi:MAG: ABC transporter permease [Synechococcales cyanobacterium CRU_2_2]|nr:ABC transporter permease [Synechococcales cyanobacterium CRU_2_2]
MNPFILILAILRRHRLITLLFVVIVALSIALGTGILSQEKALRQGSSTAADKFDIIIGAPGSQMDLLLSAVYLQPKAVELLDGKILSEVAVNPEVEFVAPLAFGDTHESFPVVGSTAEFITYLGDGKLEGRVFERIEEAIAGADVNLRIGDRFTPVHGHLDRSKSLSLDADTVTDADADAFFQALDAAHQEARKTVVGRMPRTGTPWDRALITPVESVWAIHDLPTGHDPSGPRAQALGAPFDSAFLPGVPALVVKPKSFAGAYALRSEYRGDRTTAFFPAEVLLQLYAVMGDARLVLSFLALATQVLVLLGIFAGILALMQLLRRQFGVLRAMGAPRLYLFAVLWGFLALLISMGSAIGLGLGWSCSVLLSAWLSNKTGIALHPGLGRSELWSAGRFVLIGYGLALVPSGILYRQPAIESLKQT